MLKTEYAIRMNIYIEVNTPFDYNECTNIGYQICEYIKEHLQGNEEVNFNLHESSMNEDVENELKLLCTYFIESDISNEEELLSSFCHSLPSDISCIHNNITPTQDLNITIHQCDKN